MTQPVVKPIWSMRPETDTCIDCHVDIDPYAERNYIVYDAENSEKAGRCIYRRQCAKCHDNFAAPVSTTQGHDNTPPKPRRNRLV